MPEAAVSTGFKPYYYLPKIILFDVFGKLNYTFGKY